MNRADRIEKLLLNELVTAVPETQEDICKIAARVSVAVGPVPRCDSTFLAAARGMASGLFGPAFNAADYAQKTTWIDMCERALREAADAPMKP